jgi:hypothetical protein
MLTRNGITHSITYSTSIVNSENLLSATFGLENFILLTHMNSQTNIDKRVHACIYSIQLARGLGITSTVPPYGKWGYMEHDKAQHCSHDTNILTPSFGICCSGQWIILLVSAFVTGIRSGKFLSKIQGGLGDSEDLCL